MNAEEVARALKKPHRTGSGWSACCPAHDDRNPSLSISDGANGVLVKCHAGCSQEEVLSALANQGIEIRKQKANGYHEEPQELLTLGSLAAAKKLPEQFLTECFVHDEPDGVAFEYLDASGAPFRTKYRKYLSGANRGFSTSGGKMVPYGLWRLEQMMANDARLVICEGETDTLTLWHHGFSALGISGAEGWKEDFCGIIPEGAKLFVAIDGDEAGQKFEKAFRESKLAPRVSFIRFGLDAKDPNALHCQGPSEFIERFETRIASAIPAIEKKEPRIVFRDIAEIVSDYREPEWLIDDVIEKDVTALMVGRRGSLKSFIAIDWFMQMAVAGNGVLILSAEGKGLGRRLEAWHKTFAPAVDLRSLKLKAMEKSISLRAADVLAELQEVIRAVSFKPTAILLDTFSKYSAGIDENDNSEVAQFLESLVIALKQEFECTILIVAHTGHAASDRARGASSLGANTEAEYIVERPVGPEIKCSVSRDRFKDSPSLPALAYSGEIIDLGRVDRRGKPVTSIVLRPNGEIVTPKAKSAGANQTAALVALREWVAAHPTSGVIPHDELAQLLKRQGVSAKRKPEVLNWLVNAGALLPSVGGHKVNAGAL